MSRTNAAAARSRLERVTMRREVQRAIVSVAGLVGTPVVNPSGQRVGSIVDVVARLHSVDRYPPITGMLVRIGARRSFLAADNLATVEHRRVTLRRASMDLTDFLRRPGEVLLVEDLLDHQLIDVDGRQVIRAADLYLAPIGPAVRLVGVDVSLATLLRRLGPRVWRGRPTPDRVIDWDAVSPFGEAGALTPPSVRLRDPDRQLHRMRAADLADLLEDLDRRERQALLGQLDPETAADALEEMEPDELEALLREVEPEQAAQLLGSMEPDEAVDALRDLRAGEREDLLGRMSADVRSNLQRLLRYPERRAGGFMTTVLALATPADTVGTVRDRLTALGEHRAEIDAVAVLDDGGALIADLSLWDLLTHPAATTIATLIRDEHHDPAPVTVEPMAPLWEVAQRLVRTRRPSVLVVDDAGAPVGRILADDVLDALGTTRGRIRRRRMLR
ncbi:CBS domain-containing protein [Microbacterium sp. 13-71-7]|jgi:CBS domain-containing protein|uniref:magnesium transporter MgtE N-terminal domain-containing protein n=1 Tax=Microbacterium sp. 13-71-7 TaxID=1970399 RepID=UPI000BD4DF85|nr:CBS domain-containing protein [Microbacterium sp. 13-71-7]OZB83766.1 MAG: magnesium transporter MgtE [Microbacterium sp. 13-71-7]